MGETQNLRHVRVDKYDPLYGRYSREIKATDIVIVGDKSTPSSTATDFDLATTQTDANHALYPYVFTVHSTNTAAEFIVYDDSTTALSLQVSDKSSVTINQPADSPLMRIAPSSTVTITVPGHLINNTTDTYAAFLICKKEPIPSVVEN